MQTLLHLLYFLPALIVYGIWTWYAWKDKPKDVLLSPINNAIWGIYLVFHFTIIFAIVTVTVVIMTIAGINYFIN